MRTWNSSVVDLARLLCSDAPLYGGYSCLPCQEGARLLVDAFQEGGRENLARVWLTFVARRPRSHRHFETWRVDPDPELLRLFAASIDR